MKFVMAPESTKALVYTFFPYTQSVTGILKKVVLLHTILLQDSSTTSGFCKLIVGTLSFDCRSQTLYSTVPRENPILTSPFPSHLGEQDQGFPQLTCYLLILTSSGGESGLLLSFSNIFISHALNDWFLFLLGPSGDGFWEKVLWGCLSSLPGLS